MSEQAALVKEKEELIQKMLKMQQEFVDLEHKQGLDAKEFYVPSAGTFLEEYKREYNEMAKRLNKLAHEIKGSGHVN